MSGSFKCFRFLCPVPSSPSSEKLHQVTMNEDALLIERRRKTQEPEQAQTSSAEQSDVFIWFVIVVKPLIVLVLFYY